MTQKARFLDEERDTRQRYEQEDPSNKFVQKYNCIEQSGGTKYVRRSKSIFKLCGIVTGYP